MKQYQSKIQVFCWQNKTPIPAAQITISDSTLIGQIQPNCPLCRMSKSHFKESKCKSLHRLGHCSPVAGVPRRPVIPCQAETINAVQKCVFSLKGSAALHEVVYLKDNKPNIEFTLVPEQTPQYRFNLYLQFMRKLWKQRH